VELLADVGRDPLVEVILGGLAGCSWRRRPPDPASTERHYIRGGVA